MNAPSWTTSLRRAAATALLAGICTQALATERAAPIRADYPLLEIARDVHIMVGPTELPNPRNQGFMNNPGFVIGSDGVVVIDPGSSVQVGELLLQKIATLSDKPVVAVLSTHVHGDHWLGSQAINDAYPDAPLIMHQNAVLAIKNGAGDQWLQTMLSMTRGATAGTTVTSPTVAVKGGEQLSYGGVSINVLHNGAAHTQSDLILHLPQHEVAFLGDNAGNQRTIGMNSVSGTIDALQMAIDSGASVFVPGHGTPGDTVVARNYQRFLQTIYDEAVAAVDDDKADFEVRETLLPKIASWAGWFGMEDSLGGLISAAYLEAEEESFN